MKDARSSNAVADPGDIGNPSMSTIINCAIAFTDVVTAKYIGETKKDDHQAASGGFRKPTTRSPSEKPCIASRTEG